MRIFFLFACLATNQLFARNVFELNLSTVTSNKLGLLAAMTEKSFVGLSLYSSEKYGSAFGVNSNYYFSGFENSSFFFGGEILSFKNDFYDSKINNGSLDYYSVSTKGIETKLSLGYQFVFAKNHAIFSTIGKPLFISEQRVETILASNLGSTTVYDRNALNFHLGYAFKF